MGERRILATYLNDHLAGSVAAIEPLDHLWGHSKGTEEVERFRIALAAFGT